MPHGANDYSNVYRIEFSEGLADLGEIVPRLTNASSWQKGGETLCIEDFTQGLQNWAIAAAGPNGGVKLVSDKFCSNGISCSIIGPSTDLYYTYITRYFPSMQFSTLGLEFRVLCYDTPDKFAARIHQTVDDKRYYMTVYIDFNTDTISLLTTGNVYKPIVTLPYTPQYNDMFMYIKVTGDFKTGNYLHLFVNDIKVDVSDTMMYIPGTTSISFLDIQLLAYGHNSGIRTYYVDNIIMTHNET